MALVACCSVIGTICAAVAISCWLAIRKSTKALTCGLASDFWLGYMNSGRDSGL